jgi:signal peptidase
MNIIKWLRGEGRLPGFARDLVFVLVVVGTISIISQLTLGIWTPMVAVESGSMEPNLKIGDIVLIQGASKKEIITWQEGEETNYTTFNLPGNVILYRPYGKEKITLVDQLAHLVLRRPYSSEKATPIIHRALYMVEEGKPMWEGGPPAPFSGYITKGDHNTEIDQRAGRIKEVVEDVDLEQFPTKVIWIGNEMYIHRDTGLLLIGVGNNTWLVADGISYLTPVREDWVIGVARLRVPVVGYVRLLPNIIADNIKNLLN